MPQTSSRAVHPSSRSLTVRILSLAMALAFAGGFANAATDATVVGTAIADTPIAHHVTTRPDFKAIVNRIAPSVVGVLVRRQSMAERPLGEVSDDDLSAEMQRRMSHRGAREAPSSSNGPSSLGSGFITTADGYVITNAHVVAEAESVIVKLNDRREIPARVVGVDKPSDIALLKIEAPGLSPVRLGDGRRLEVGEWVLAVGTPFGFERTVTQGIVSALGRSLPGEPYVPFIQTDVPINPGNSGGPLFDEDGRVVGINSRIYSGTGGYMGLSFAIPVDVAIAVAHQLQATGKVARGYLGVNIQDLDQDLASAFGMVRPHGALIGASLQDGPAAGAGLHSGDVIVRYNDRPVEDAARLRALIAASTPGKPVPVTVLRSGVEHPVSVMIGQAPESVAMNDGAGEDDGAHAVTGTVVSDVDPMLRKALGGAQGGVVIVKVGEGPLAEAGVRAGDVLLAIDGETIRDTSHFRSQLENLRKDRPVPVMVVREGVTGFVALKPPMARQVSLKKPATP